MVYKKFGVKPNGILSRKGAAPNIEEFRIEAAANMYAGSHVRTGTTEDDIFVGDALHSSIGWLAYEDTDPIARPATVTTIYEVGKRAMVLSGMKFMPTARLAKGCVVAYGDKVAGWTGGTVVGPVVPYGPGLALGIPFAKSTAELSTSILLPADLLIGTPFIDVSTNAGGTIDVGILSTEAGGKADGFLDGVSCAALGKIGPVMTGASAGAISLGTLLQTPIKDATGTAIYAGIPTLYRTDGTAATVTYTTSNHTIAGTIWLPMFGEGLQVIGMMQENLDASAAITRAFVYSEL